MVGPEHVHVGDIDMDIIIVSVYTEWMVLQSGVRDLLVRCRATQGTVPNLHYWKLYWMMHRMMHRVTHRIVHQTRRLLRQPGFCTFFPQLPPYNTESKVPNNSKWPIPYTGSARGKISTMESKANLIPSMRYRYAICRPTVIIAVS